MLKLNLLEIDKAITESLSNFFKNPCLFQKPLYTKLIDVPTCEPGNLPPNLPGSFLGGFMGRRIIVSGGIDEETYKAFSEELAEFEDESDNDVELELNSHGGDAESALAFAGRIRTSKCRINVIVSGACYSAAVLILASGETRLMTSESWVMVHEDQNKTSGSVSQREKDVAHYRRMENQWNCLMEFYTTTTASKWAEMHKVETYLNANQCLELGLIDKVV